MTSLFGIRHWGLSKRVSLSPQHHVAKQISTLARSRVCFPHCLLAMFSHDIINENTMAISSCNKLLGDIWIFLMKRFFADGESVSCYTIAVCYFCMTALWLISNGKPLIISLDLSLSLHVRDRGSWTAVAVPLLVNWCEVPIVSPSVDTQNTICYYYFKAEETLPTRHEQRIVWSQF